MTNKRNDKGEDATQRASRKWKNKDLIERFKRAKETGDGADDFLTIDGKKPFINAEVPKPPKIGETITNGGRRDGSIKRFESRFVKEIRMRLNEHKLFNLRMYAASIEHRRRKLLAEKLHRLKLAHQEPQTDLFGPVGVSK